jgi:hypothetical protein
VKERKVVKERFVSLEEAIERRAMKKVTTDEIINLKNQIKINRSLAATDDARR